MTIRHIHDSNPNLINFGLEKLRKVNLPFRTDVCRLGQATVVRPADPTRRIISKRSGHKSEGLRMGAAFIPLILFTIIFAVVAILLPIFVPKNPYRG